MSWSVVSRMWVSSKRPKAKCKIWSDIKQWCFNTPLFYIHTRGHTLNHQSTRKGSVQNWQKDTNTTIHLRIMILMLPSHTRCWGSVDEASGTFFMVVLLQFRWTCGSKSSSTSSAWLACCPQCCFPQQKISNYPNKITQKRLHDSWKLYLKERLQSRPLQQHTAHKPQKYGKFSRTIHNIVTPFTAIKASLNYQPR